MTRQVRIRARVLAATVIAIGALAFRLAADATGPTSVDLAIPDAGPTGA